MRINNINELPADIQKQIEQKIGKVKRPSKYHNERTIADGQEFASGREAERYGQLKLLERADEITALSTQVWFLLEPGNKVNRPSYYIADFVYFDCRLKEWVVEDTKGKRTPEYILKKKAMYNLYGIDIKEV